MRAYNSADVFDAGIFPSPAGRGWRRRAEKKERASAQQEARCSADKRAFRVTTRDHILQLMRLDLTLRYFAYFFTSLTAGVNILLISRSSLLVRRVADLFLPPGRLDRISVVIRGEKS